MGIRMSIPLSGIPHNNSFHTGTADLVAHDLATSTHGVAQVGGITNGSYTGDGGANRTIPHGLGVTPKMVILIWNNGGVSEGTSGLMYNTISRPLSGVTESSTAWDTTNFHVSGTVYNVSGQLMLWVALV